MLRFKLDLRDKEPTLTDYLEFKMYFLEVELESLASELAIYSKKKGAGLAQAYRAQFVIHQTPREKTWPAVDVS